MSETLAIKRVGVVGCGIMGAGITELCARSGVEVVVRVLDEQGADAGRSRVDALLRRSARREKLSDADVDAIRSRVSFVLSLSELSQCDLVIEAVPEVEAVKLAVFQELSEVFGEADVVLATNMSSLSVARLAGATAHPERVLGLHFFNPVAALPLVELVSSLRTDPALADAVAHFASDALGKTVVRVNDTPGFVVNALLIPYICSAIRLVEGGMEAAAVDTAMTLGCGHPMGPLRLADLIGLDTVASIAESLYASSGSPHHAPPVLLTRMVDAGVLGDKAGGGFYRRGN